MHFRRSGMALIVVLGVAATMRPQQSSTFNVFPRRGCPNVPRGSEAVFHLKYDAPLGEAEFHEKFEMPDGNRQLLQKGGHRAGYPGEFIFSYMVPLNAPLGKWNGVGIEYVGQENNSGTSPKKTVAEQIKELCFVTVDHL